MASGGEDALRVVLLGKTGAGKSSLGNALANIKEKGEQFKVGRGLKSETLYCAWKKGIRNGLAVEVTDTPGLCDTHMDDKLIYKEVGKSVAVAEPGPHVLVFILRCDRRFTKEEYDAYQTIKEMFSSEMNRFMILVFNGLDTYDNLETIEEQREELGKEIDNFGNELNEMLREANGRYFGMNNKASPAEMERQICDLIRMMQSLVAQNGNEYYTTPVTAEIKKQVDVLIEKRVAQKHISQDQAADEVKRGVDTLRVVLLGKKGAGKSSLGNALANIKEKGEQFKVCRGLKLENLKCVWKRGTRNGLAVEVTDTPGLCDTHMDDKLICKEVGKSVAVAEPGPHVFVFTLRCDRRFTKEEYDAYQTIKEMFSSEMNRFMILVFNGLDTYDNLETIEEQRAELGKEIKTAGKELNEMLKEANGRYFGMNNKASAAERERQICDLIRMMQSLVAQNGNRYYTHPVTTENKEKDISQDQAADEVKRDIVAEKVDPDFFESVGNVISSAASRVKNACSVM